MAPEWLASFANNWHTSYNGRMPTRNVNLTPKLDQVIDAAVESGQYENASEVVRAALRLFAAYERKEAMKMEKLRRALNEGDKSGVFKGDATDSVMKELGLDKPTRPRKHRAG